MPKVPAIHRLDPAPGLLAAAVPVEPLFARRTDERFLGAFAPRVSITDVSVLKRRSAELLGVLLAEKH